jgi:hypothetical protein
MSTSSADNSPSSSPSHPLPGNDSFFQPGEAFLFAVDSDGSEPFAYPATSRMPPPEEMPRKEIGVSFHIPEAKDTRIIFN